MKNIGIGEKITIMKKMSVIIHFSETHGIVRHVSGR